MTSSMTCRVCLPLFFMTQKKTRTRLAAIITDIIPLYMGYDENGNMYVASEMKALVPVCRTIKEFPAGSYLWSQDGEIREYYHRDWFDFDNVKDNVTDANIERCAEESVSHPDV